MNIYHILFTIAIGLLLGVLALYASVAHEVREEMKAMKEEQPSSPKKEGAGSKRVVVMIILFTVISFSCSTTAKRKHYTRIHPNGYWTLRGFHPPVQKADTATILTKK